MPAEVPERDDAGERADRGDGHVPILDAAPESTVETLLRARLAELLGGWRGAAEVAVPTVAFVLVWNLSHDVVRAAVVSVALALALSVIRLAQRQTLTYAAGALFPTIVAAVIAVRTGQAEDAFLPGILWNVAMGVVAVVSVLVRWPLLGFMVAAADPDAKEDLGVYTRWRAHSGLVSVCSRLTLVLAVLFLGRVVIMLPLYLQAQVEALGVAKLLLGWPAYVAAVLVMAGMLVRGRTPLH